MTPDLIREDENAGVAAEGRLGRDTIETVKDGVARWLQVEDIKHAGGGSGADSAGSVPCSSSSAVREGFSAFGRNAASS